MGLPRCAAQLIPPGEMRLFGPLFLDAVLFTGWGVFFKLPACKVDSPNFGWLSYFWQGHYSTSLR
jgi:hypothetical protein